MTLCFLLCLFT